MGNEVALEQAVATIGPVSVAVDSRSFYFHFYKSGEGPNVCSLWSDFGGRYIAIINIAQNEAIRCIKTDSFWNENCPDP